MPEHQSLDENSEFLQKLVKGVNASGYPSEIRTAIRFQKAGWIVLDHMYFVDKDENIGREIDLYAASNYFAESDQKRIRLNISLAVEVKKSTKRPWAILTTPKTNLDIDRKGEIFLTSLARMHHQEIWFHELYANHPAFDLDCLGRVAFYGSIAQNPGKETEAEGNKSAETAFKALISAGKASVELSATHQTSHNEALREGIPIKKTYVVGITHGLLVVDAQLFLGRLDENDNLILEPTKYVPYVMNYASEKYGYKRILVDIVHIDHLPKYIENYGEWGKNRAQFCLEQL